MPGLQKRFNRLHANITLGPTQTTRVQDAVSHLRSFVADDPVLASGLADEPFLQGSYAQDTQIRPHNGEEFDVDVVLPITTDFVRKHGPHPQEILDVLFTQLAEDSFYEGRLERKDRCIRIKYAGEFRVDVTPCKQTEGRLEAPSKKTNSWSATDPKGLMEWLEDKNKESDGHFKRSTKFLKVWVRRTFAKGHRPPSVALVVFAARHQPMEGRRQTDDRYVLKTRRDGGDGAFITDLFTIMLSCVQGKSGRVEVPNPTNKNEDLARDWKPDDYANFCEKLRHAARVSRRAYDESDIDKSTRDWQELFGDDFPASDPE